MQRRQLRRMALSGGSIVGVLTIVGFSPLAEIVAWCRCVVKLEVLWCWGDHAPLVEDDGWKERRTVKNQIGDQVVVTDLL